MRASVVLLALAAACTSHGVVGDENEDGTPAAADADRDGNGGGSRSSPSNADADAFGNSTADVPNFDGIEPEQDDPGNRTADPDDDDCGGVEVVPHVEMELIPANVLLVYDKSGSMCWDWGGGVGTKWQDARTAIYDAVMPLQDNVRAGAIFFPDRPTTGEHCIVPPINAAPQMTFREGPSFLSAWASYWNTVASDPTTCVDDDVISSVNGATPLLNALTVADAALASAPADGITTIVVLTDGEPNCSGPDEQENEPLDHLTPLVTAWSQAGHPTYVVGLPGVDAAVPLLDGIAAAGGTGQHIPADDPATLQAELSAIIESSVTSTFDDCTIALPSTPPNLDDVVLVVVSGGQEQSVARDLGAGGGWVLDDAGTQITLHGQLCDNARGGDYERISVVFGCVTFPPLPAPTPD